MYFAPTTIHTMSEKRRELDPIFKQIITDLLAPLPMIVETEVIELEDDTEYLQIWSEMKKTTATKEDLPHGE